MLKNNQNHFGFTMVELLVVIAIVGLLASLSMAGLQNARKNSRDARRKGDLKQMATALDLYLSSTGNGSYPVQSDWAHFEDSSLSNLVSSGLLIELPSDPLVNKGYYFDYKSDGTDYKIMAQLEKDTDLMENDGGTYDSKYELFTPNFSE